MIIDGVDQKKYHTDHISERYITGSALQLQVITFLPGACEPGWCDRAPKKILWPD